MGNLNNCWILVKRIGGLSLHSFYFYICLKFFIINYCQVFSFDITKCLFTEITQWGNSLLSHLLENKTQEVDTSPELFSSQTYSFLGELPAPIHWPPPVWALFKAITNFTRVDTRPKIVQLDSCYQRFKTGLKSAGQTLLLENFGTRQNYMPPTELEKCRKLI